MIKLHNPYISWLKGLAILAIIYIHLVDWSNLILTPTAQDTKEIAYTAVFFFVALTGSLVHIAYSRYEDLSQASQRVVYRGLQLWAIYFGYSLLKFYVYDFDHEPFYTYFQNDQALTAEHILNLHSFSTPLSILLTIGACLIITPLLLWLNRKVRGAAWYIAALLVGVLLINYIFPLPHNALTDFLYARDNITFSFLLWLPVFLIGYLLAMIGFEKYRYPLFVLSGVAAFYLLNSSNSDISWWPRLHMYPLEPYYMTFSLMVMMGLTILLFWIRNWLPIQAPLKALQAIGEHTLHIYVGHIIVIDLTLWAVYPETQWIWVTVLGFVAIYLLYVGTKKLLRPR